MEHSGKKYVLSLEPNLKTRKSPNTSISLHVAHAHSNSQMIIINTQKNHLIVILKHLISQIWNLDQG